MNFFNLSKLKTPLLLGAMLLSTVACSNYDDEINDLSGRLDNIEGSYVTISSMESQIAAVKADIPDLTSINSRLSALEGDAGDVEAIQDAVDALQDVIDALNTTISSSIDSTVTEDFLTDILDGVYLTQVTLSDIEDLVGDENEGLIYDIVKAMESSAKWVGNDELASYLAISDFDTYAAAYFATIKEALIADAADAAIAGISIADSEITLSDGTVTTIQAALEDALSRVSELEGRIQSLVFVPTTTSSTAASFKGQDYIKINDVVTYLTPVDGGAKELTYRVTPASWAAKFTKENVTLYSEELTRAEQPFSIESITASEEEEEEGKFTVKLAYNLDSAPITDYAIALHINMEAVASETSETDYVSSYVNVSVAEGTDMTSLIRYYGINSSGNPSYYNYIFKQYTYTEAIDFRENLNWYLYSGGEYTLFSDVYTNEDIFKVVPQYDDPQILNADADAYTIKQESVKINDGYNSTSLIDNSFMQEYNAYLVSGTEDKLVGYAYSYIFIQQLTHEFATTTWELDWAYDASYYTSKSDLNKCIEVLEMDADLFNIMYNTVSYSTCNVLDSTGASVAGASATVTLLSGVNADSDIKPIKVTLSGIPATSAEYTIVYTKSNVDGDKVIISIPVKFNGIPEINTLEAITTESDFDGSTSAELISDLAAELWAANPDLANHMTEDQFKAEISSASTSATSSEAGMSLSKSGDALQVNYTFPACEFGKTYEMTYTIASSSLGDFVISANVTLNNPYSESIVRAESYFTTRGVEIETAFNANGVFDVVNKDLKSTHNIADVTITTVYTVGDITEWIDANPTATVPAVVGDILYWNDYSEADLPMIVKAYVGGVEVDSATFNAYIVEPLGEMSAKTMNLYIDDLAGSVDLKDALTLMESKSSPAANIFPTDYAKFGSAPMFTYVESSDETVTPLVAKSGDIVSFSSAATTSAVLNNDITYTYSVSYQTKYFGEKTAKVVVKVNKAGVSAN